MEHNDKILVGKIVASQGIRGDVRVQAYTASPDDLKTMTVFGDKIAPGDLRFVRRLNPTSNVVIAHIRGVDDRNTSDTLRGTELFVSRNMLPATADGEYYQSDLIGFAVVRDGETLGMVECFQNFGAGDIIQLDTGDMVSFIGANVDISNKTIYVK